MNTVGNCVDAFLSECQIELRPRTLSSYQNALNQFDQWMLENKGFRLDIKKVTPAIVKEFKEHLLALGRKPQTISKILTAIKTFFNWTVDKGYLEFNPAVAVEGVQQEKAIPKWLNKKEKEELFKIVYQEENLRNTLIIKLMIFAGLQVGEIVELKKDQIITQNKRLWLEVGAEKAQKPRRIPLCKNLSSTLEEYLEKQPNNGYLFGSQRKGRLNEQLSMRAVQHMIKNYGEKAGLKDLNANVLRHTFGYDLCQKGTDVYTVAVLMGYSTQTGVPNIQTVLQYITDFQDFEKQIEKSMEDAVEKLDVN